MQENREKFSFPTRSYSYRSSTRKANAFEAEPRLEAGRIYRFVMGVDNFPGLMPDAEAETLLRDSFAELLLKRGTFPLTVRDLLSALDALNDNSDGLPQQKVFLVADGGQIDWTPETANVNRLFRFAVARSRNDDVRLLVSASTALDSETQFLQVLSWDAANQVYSYYERRVGAWIWAGNSHHALLPGSRGAGPFDSHVNGSLVMKELRAPWCNWNSMNAAIREDALAPDDALRAEPLFLNRASASELERNVVRPGIERWNRARFQHSLSEDGKTLRDMPFFLRQILQTTTVNLASSSRQSNRVGDDEPMDLPITFFLNTEALLDYVELDPDISPISIAGKFYNDSLRRYDFTLRDGEFSQKGDTFFGFLIPEPAFEDLNLLALLLERKIISRRFAACLLMIDFPNPVFSAKRAQMMQFVPPTANITGGALKTDFETRFTAILESVIMKMPASHASHEFLANWRLPEKDWKRTFESRIEDYFNALQEKSRTDEGFDAWTRLAESRRREFRGHPLAEFRLTTPSTNIPEDAPLLEMRADAAVQAKR